MDTSDFEQLLRQTFDDHRLSRSERQALGQVLNKLTGANDRAEVCRRAFQLARASEGPEVLDWLESIVKMLVQPHESSHHSELAEVHFSPGENCPRRIVQLFGNARRSIDVCVFTITDDRITSAVIDAHQRGVAVRVITDNDKVSDEGSDILRLDEASIPVRVDRTEYHMHHKFAIFDDAAVLTGSYNWTRGAARFNNENFIVSNDRRFIHPFTQTFERLWEALG